MRYQSRYQPTPATVRATMARNASMLRMHLPPEAKDLPATLRQRRAPSACSTKPAQGPGQPATACRVTQAITKCPEASLGQQTGLDNTPAQERMLLQTEKTAKLVNCAGHTISAV